MKNKIGNFTEALKDRGVKIVDAVDFYQSSCWHCKDIWIDGRNPTLDPDGLICPTCKQLNFYGHLPEGWIAPSA